ncbi:CD40 ligand-like [Carcharodon carcharias]|uniref:CD40 ligand n=1 Tax=Carcharodon carcharias TaxID=13397 RepID=UPI001B7E9A4C|nr:CD40 ligand [Carcharodon carcharias]
MSETSNKLTEQRQVCEHQPSVSVRVLIHLIVVLLLGHMVTSALLYVYFSVKLDKVQEIVNTDPEYMFLKIIKKCENKNHVEKDQRFCDDIRPELQHRIQEYLANNTEQQLYGTGDPKQEKQIGSHPDTMTDKINNLHRTAAHLIATNRAENTPDSAFPDNKGQPIKQWMAKGFPAFTNNINYTSGKLVITEPGFYYVYCQISFRLSSNKSDNLTSAPFLQYVYLQRIKEQATLLMKASKTPVDKKEAASFNSVNQGGVFKLKTGDKLFVTVTKTDLLSYDRATYFGIFQL